MDELKQTLKQQITEALNLEDTEPDDIEDAAPLFGEGLGLDSIDALELVVMLEREHGIRITEREEGRAAFASIDSLARYVSEKRST
ncbi:MAG: acyl carrier protein [bacterium]|nr:acyl carrier protein [bacterium]